MSRSQELQQLRRNISGALTLLGCTDHRRLADEPFDEDGVTDAQTWDCPGVGVAIYDRHGIPCAVLISETAPDGVELQFDERPSLRIMLAIHVLMGGLAA